MADPSAQGEGAPPIRKNTEAMYNAIVRGLEKFSERRRSSDLETPPKVSLDNVIDDLRDRTDISADTKKGYRAALLWAIRTSPMSEDMKAYGVQRLEALKKPPGPKPKKEPVVHRSTVSVEDLQAIEGYLAERCVKSVWVNRTLVWVQATGIAGLRAAEWLAAEWDDVKKVLRVETGKVKAAEPAFMRNRRKERCVENEGEEGVAHAGEHPEEPRVREIPIASEHDQHLVRYHLSALETLVPKTLDDDARLVAFGKYYHQCKSVFTRCCLALFKERRYSFRTFRSQFSANMKAAVGSSATAVLMGHSGPDSPSASHYGKANQAHPAFKGMRPKLEPGQEQDAPGEGEGPVRPAEG